MFQLEPIILRTPKVPFIFDLPKIEVFHLNFPEMKFVSKEMEMPKSETEKNDTCRPELEKIKQDKYQCPVDGADFILHKSVPNKHGTESQDLYHCPECHKDFQKGTVENP